MAWTYTQYFNTLSTAALEGQDSWVSIFTGSGNFNVQTSVTYEGAKGVSVANATESYIKREVTGAPTGICQMAMRSSDFANPSVEFSLGETATSATAAKGRIKLNGGGGNTNNIILRGASDVSIQAGASNTWYLCDLEYDCSTDQIRGRVDGGAWTSWINFAGSSNLTNIDWIYISKENGSASAVYWDTLGSGDTVASSRDARMLNILGVG